MIHLNPQPGKHTLLGLSLGQPLSAQQAELDALRAVGFVGEMDQTTGEPGQFVLQKMASSTTHGFDLGLILVSDSQGHLIRITLASGVMPWNDSPASISLAARRLKDYLTGEMGPPSAFLDNIEAWSQESSNVLPTQVAYAAFWRTSSALSVQACAGADVAGEQPDVDAFLSCMRGDLAGLCAVASISASQGGIVATLDMVRGLKPPALPTAEQSLFSKRRDLLLNLHDI